MARSSSLLKTSCHAHQIIKNIPVGELIRLKRNNLENDNYIQQEKDIYARLHMRLST